MAQDLVAHRDQAEHQDQVVHLAPAAHQDQEAEPQDQAVSEHRGQNLASHLLAVQVPAVVAAVGLEQPEPLVRADQRASPESQSAQSARNLNKEKHRA